MGWRDPQWQCSPGSRQRESCTHRVQGASRDGCQHLQEGNHAEPASLTSRVTLWHSLEGRSEEKHMTSDLLPGLPTSLVQLNKRAKEAADILFICQPSRTESSEKQAREEKRAAGKIEDRRHRYGLHSSERITFFCYPIPSKKNTSHTSQRPHKADIATKMLCYWKRSASAPERTQLPRCKDGSLCMVCI